MNRMPEINEAGFDGSCSCGRTIINFRRGYDKVELKEFLYMQPYNQFFWLKKDRELFYRNKKGDFFKLKFEKIEI